MENRKARYITRDVHISINPDGLDISISKESQFRRQQNMNESSALTEILEVDPDLVHAPGVGPAQHHALGAVVAEPLELSVTLLASARPRHAAHTDLVADHLDALPALD